MGGNFSIIICDIDWFKNINDTYGHTTGDKVLQTIAEYIKNRSRETDIVGRWGGEEFLIICPDTSSTGAKKLAEDIRKDIQNQSFGVNKSITISAGTATYTDSIQDIEEFVNKADINLYRAKEHKNQVFSN